MPVSRVDEKGRIRALDRTRPVLPMMPRIPERRTHDREYNGIDRRFRRFKGFRRIFTRFAEPDAPVSGFVFSASVRDAARWH